MSWPFGTRRSRKSVFASPRKPIDIGAHGRLLGLTEDGSEALVAPNGHSLLTAAAGSGKTVNGAATSLISCAASFPNKAILVVDSKNGELFGQFGDVLARYGRKVALIDPMGVFPANNPYRVNLNPMGAVVSAFKHAPDELIFATEGANAALIPDPSDDEQRPRIKARRTDKGHPTSDPETISRWDGVITPNKKGFLSIDRKLWQQLEEPDRDFVRTWNSRVAHREDTTTLVPPANITIQTRTRRVTFHGMDPDQFQPSSSKLLSSKKITMNLNPATAYDESTSSDDQE